MDFKEMQDKSFSTAAAMPAELLRKLAVSVNEAVRQGTSLAEWRAEVQGIVARR